MKGSLGFIVLGLQALLLWLFEKFLSPSLFYVSAYGTSQAPFFMRWLVIIPIMLMLGQFVPRRYRAYFYFLASLIVVQSLELAALVTVLAGLIFFATKTLKESRLLTTGLYLFVVAGIAASGFLLLQTSSVFVWIWLMIHVSWGLKLIAWITSVRIYKYDYALTEFLDYFFNPVFFFFTNDLNVLTPRRFLQSTGKLVLQRQTAFACIKMLVIGLALVTVYGLLQNYYFTNLSAVGLWSNTLVGGAISVATAIIFHAANVFVQISLLRAQGYDLVVDMDKPWLASSPMDYWKRMHFYVREYIFEIIVRPVLTTLLRHQQNTRLIKVLSVILLYFLFTCTQLGYQPFRQNRPWQIGFLVTGVFMAMIIVPEYLSRQAKFEIFFKHKYWGRILTFALLLVGYSLIFSFRSGF